MSTAYLISLTNDASDRVPPLRPLIYHEEGRGEVLHHRKAKIGRARAEGGREGERQMRAKGGREKMK